MRINAPPRSDVLCALLYLLSGLVLSTSTNTGPCTSQSHYICSTLLTVSWVLPAGLLVLVGSSVRIPRPYLVQHSMAALLQWHMILVQQQQSYWPWQQQILPSAV